MVKSFNIIGSVFIIIVGVFAIISFVILLINGDNMKEYMLALIIAVFMVVRSIIDLRNALKK